MRFIRLVLICLAIGLTGCASGVKYKDMSSSIAPVKSDQGRVYFYRVSSMVGAAIQPDIKLDKTAVGQSKPGGFFYIDTVPGDHSATTATEVERELTFSLDPGETKYVRTAPSWGVFVGHITPELVGPNEALKELQEISYIGTVATSNMAGNGNTLASGDTSTYNSSSAAKTEPSDSRAAPVAALKVGFKLGQSSNTVEKMAKQRGCESKEGAGLITDGGPVEVYRLTCLDGSTYLARCELRQCAPMQ